MFTIKMAKANFFDPKAFADPIRRAKARILSRFGATVRSIAKKMIKPASDWDDHAPPGAPPKSHTGKRKYKDFIFFFHDKANDTVIIGGALLPRKDRTIVPGVLEYGGETEQTYFEHGVKKTRVVMQEPRPHMRKAYDIAVKKLLPDLIKNSIVP